MEIQDLKNNLEITAVAEQIGITIDKKTKRALCPFHNDKNPSLQFSQEKQIATCFSSNCTAGTMDVIKLTEKKLQKSTHETLNYLKELAGALRLRSASTGQQQQTKEKPANYPTAFEQMQSSFMSSSTARNYAESRHLDWKQLTIGYNAFKSSRFDYLRGCIIFALKNKDNQIVSLYGRSIKNNSNAKHYYTANRKGFYPYYPLSATRKLILTESIIDAATLLSVEKVSPFGGDLEGQVYLLYMAPMV